MKVQLDFDEKGKAFVDSLLTQTDSKTYKDLVNTTLTLLQWAIQQRVAGRHIASIDDKNQTYRELVMPAIEAAVQRQPAPASHQTHQADEIVAATAGRY